MAVMPGGLPGGGLPAEATGRWAPRRGYRAAAPGRERRRRARTRAATRTSTIPTAGAACTNPVPGSVPRWGSVADPGAARPGLSTAPAGAAPAGAGAEAAGAARGWRRGRPRAIRRWRRSSLARYQPPLVVVSSTGWPGVMKVSGPPAAYGHTDWRTLSAPPAPLGKVQVIV